MEALECNGCDIMANNMGTFLHHFAMNLQFFMENSASFNHMELYQCAEYFNKPNGNEIFEPLAVAFAR